MFVQVFTGHTSDSAGLRRQMDRWNEKLRPGAEGFLGSTAGATADGRFVALARFRDEAAARANADRPEQTAWWNETAKLFDREPVFLDSTDIEVIEPGGSNDAGFVQVMIGRVRDRERYTTLGREMEGPLRELRPDFIGNIVVWKGNEFVDASYFTSEADARAGEAKEPPESLAPKFDEWRSLVEEIDYLDLTDPWLT